MSQTTYNPIGGGTRNFQLNAPVDWLKEMKRAACDAGVSAGDFMRRLMERGAEAESPQLARKLKAHRQRYYGGALLVLFVALLVGGDEFSARVRRAKRSREEDGITWEVS